MQHFLLEMMSRILLLASILLTACAPMESRQAALASGYSPIGGGQAAPGSDVPTPFDSLVPQQEVWVAPYGNDDNSGSLFSPKQTLSAAFGMATPGTAIMVKSGRYSGGLDIGEFDGGVNNRPIWVRSADGFGAAEIVGDVKFSGTRQVVLEGFRISGSVTVTAGTPPPGSPSDAIGGPAVYLLVQNNIVGGDIDVSHSQAVYVLGNLITPARITLNECVGCIVDGNEAP